VDRFVDRFVAIVAGFIFLYLLLGLFADSTLPMALPIFPGLVLGGVSAFLAVKGIRAEYARREQHRLQQSEFQVQILKGTSIYRANRAHADDVAVFRTVIPV
jgi:hypothetical protein